MQNIQKLYELTLKLKAMKPLAHELFDTFYSVYSVKTDSKITKL